LTHCSDNKLAAAAGLVRSSHAAKLEVIDPKPCSGLRAASRLAAEAPQRPRDKGGNIVKPAAHSAAAAVQTKMTAAAAAV
jgi:hypothetical protein